MKNIILTLATLFTMTVSLFAQSNKVTAFDAYVSEGKVMLQWTSADNGPHAFVVEKSVDGRNFEAAGIKSSNAGSEFSFTDVNTTSGTNYYRIMNIEKTQSNTGKGWIHEVAFTLASDIKVVVVNGNQTGEPVYSMR